VRRNGPTRAERVFGDDVDDSTGWPKSETKFGRRLRLWVAKGLMVCNGHAARTLTSWTHCPIPSCPRSIGTAAGAAILYGHSASPGLSLSRTPATRCLSRVDPFFSTAAAPALACLLCLLAPRPPRPFFFSRLAQPAASPKA
jgi:hypothetical protein